MTDAFNPDRYANDASRDFENAYLPFSIKCIGAAFALQEAVLILSSVARHIARSRSSVSCTAAGRSPGLIAARQRRALRLAPSPRQSNAEGTICRFCPDDRRERLALLHHHLVVAFWSNVNVAEASGGRWTTLVNAACHRVQRATPGMVSSHAHSGSHRRWPAL
jgi:hypothetical protein